MTRAAPVRRALQSLGVRNLALGIHDPAFPAAPDEDVGRGTPYGEGGWRFLEFAKELGFDGIQLGPQGLTGEGNPSPYDGALFSRSTLSIALAPLTTATWGGLLPRQTLERIVAARPGPAERVAYAYAFGEIPRALDQAWRAFRERGAADEGDLGARFAEFRRGAERLERDALHAALSDAHGGAPWREWRDAAGAPHPDQRLWSADAGPGVLERREALRRLYAARLEGALFAQFLAHEQHRAFREQTRALGLCLWGDLQIGVSAADAWAHRDLFLESYRMGAPPSRTNPAGQPWGYPVLDPRRRAEALRFVAARLERAFTDYDAVRVDHPHGLVCPWVYRADQPDAGRAVRAGARLLESPDLPDHPELAALALVAPEQLRREVPRHADDWVRELSEAQVRRYSVLIGAVVAAARRHGQGPERIACEVLSTCPLPLRRVLEHHGLGRCRVTQKVDLGEPRDVYRSENAAPEDWILMGNHDTPPIWRVVEQWIREGSARRHAEHLAGRLLPHAAPREAWIARVAADPRELAQAKFAELFVGPARNVMVFFTDLFGYRTPYNEPGTVHADNWSLRLGYGFRHDYERARSRGEALDLPRALALALRSRGAAFAATHAALLTELESSDIK